MESAFQSMALLLAQKDANGLRIMIPQPVLLLCGLHLFCLPLLMSNDNLLTLLAVADTELGYESVMSFSLAR